MGLFFSSCLHDHTNISIHEQRDSYQFYASYNESQTEAVQKFLNEEISIKGSQHTANAEKIGMLNDDAKIYIESSPGKIKIKLDKRENTDAQYEHTKHICKQLMKVLK